jgi:hypothetical protein
VGFLPTVWPEISSWGLGYPKCGAWGKFERSERRNGSKRAWARDFKGREIPDLFWPFAYLTATTFQPQFTPASFKIMNKDKTLEIAEAREDAPEIVEDEVLKKGHMNYDLVDEEVAKYASETIVEVDEETSSRLKRMIDKRILAIMIGTYLIQTLDKGTMSFASIMGIIDETHLVGTQVCICSKREGAEATR